MTITEETEFISKVVNSLEVCWRCQRVCETERHVLGNLVSIWLCASCLQAVELAQLSSSEVSSGVNIS